MIYSKGHIILVIDVEYGLKKVRNYCSMITHTGTGKVKG